MMIATMAVAVVMMTFNVGAIFLSQFHLKNQSFEEGRHTMNFSYAVLT
jgi:hypothetical protein